MANNEHVPAELTDYLDEQDRKVNEQVAAIEALLLHLGTWA